MKEIKIAGKLKCNFNTQLQQHMDNVGSKLNALVDAIKLARNDGYNLTVDISKLETKEEKKIKDLKQPMNSGQLYEVREYDNRLSSDEAVNHLADTFIQMKNIMDRVAIEDCWYSKEFFEEVENALITMAVIKAFGIGKKSERYLGVVKKVVRGLKDI